MLTRLGALAADSGPVLVLASIAAAGSFTHIRQTANQHGQHGWMAWAIAVCIDLTCVMAARVTAARAARACAAAVGAACTCSARVRARGSTAVRRRVACVHAARRLAATGDQPHGCEQHNDVT